jgi:hypothetical protein
MIPGDIHIKKQRGITCFLVLVILSLNLTGYAQDKHALRVQKKLGRQTAELLDLVKEWNYIGSMSVDSIRVNKGEQTINYYLNPIFSQIPVRNTLIEAMKSQVRNSLNKQVKNYTISFRLQGRLLEDFVPNAYRMNKTTYDKNRMISRESHPMLVYEIGAPVFPSGLWGSHIALWPGHGLFFDQKADRWQWQRARLWQTVEDVLPWSFATQYLTPMLEHSGAVVLMPRERDTQVHEVIVDNDKATGNSEIIQSIGKTPWVSKLKGFMWADTLYPGQNPFEMGTGLSRVIEPGDTTGITYIPDIPESGLYAVYVSFPKSDRCMSNVQYEVRYSGGVRYFVVNQCMGFGTWVNLGTFHFNKGKNCAMASVTITAASEGVLTTDAVRFGGGIGNVARKPEAGIGLFVDTNQPGHLVEDTLANGYKTSGKPRWMEGSRYYLQYAGMPDSIVYSLNKEKNDYNDDYMSRPEWVNYLIGNSRAQYSSRYDHGLNVPIDLAFALHTDAGVTPGDSVIGTLGIFSTVRNGGIFPDGRSKMASRDLTDLIQSQVVDDIRHQVNAQWTRRGLWDREYSEAWRPVVPTSMLELLSHQNFADMRYGLDPRFKFIAARAVYKGILKYIAVAEDRNMVVQPLPPDHMDIEVINGKTVRLSWKPVLDPEEPSAVAQYYKVYQSTENQGFAPGTTVNEPFLVLELPNWNKIFNFKVTALNDGGESFPGEVLSVSLVLGDSHPVLVVNAFDRLSGPAFFDKGDMSGVAWWDDEGVSYGNDFSATGKQYNFSRNSDWISDENQGWGASYADMEARPASGNTFFFPYIHGKALRDAGYSFISTSDEVFEQQQISASDFRAIDVIFGEERGSMSLNNTGSKEFRVFTPDMMKSIGHYLDHGGNLFISGAYIGTDMVENADTTAIHFASDMLHFIWRTNHATNRGEVEVTHYGATIFPTYLKFNTDAGKDIYRVESPDAIEPVGKGAHRIYRYSSGDACAGVMYFGKYKVLVLGFPFETLEDKQQTEFMRSMMKFFNSLPPK